MVSLGEVFDKELLHIRIGITYNIYTLVLFFYISKSI